ncbi:MAG TPA: tripartite tricarboxylate transporter permease [Thermodesulfobacteriota bacterium]|nr:tripartite tricarboxylate transporter permease [Thermodesulfobacteriota bacterium]
MEFGLLAGFWKALSPVNLWYCFLGSLLGTVVGVLPALGPATTIAILLPVTAYLKPTESIIMLAGIFYGAMYGGSTTSILMNIPGEAASVPTCLDGFQMTKRGRAGEALAIAAIGSFIAGTAGVLLLSFAGPLFAELALAFGPPEYFGLMFFSLTALFSFSGHDLLKGLTAGVVGIILATVGLDPLSGTHRLAFGIPQLLAGLDVIPVLIGLFGVAEVLASAEEEVSSVYQGKLGRLIPRGEELKKGLWASLRGTGIGLLAGLFPGFMPSVVTFISYDIERRVSKHPEKFGTGMIEGVASPEAANNATCQAGFVPLMALGVPTAPIFAMLLASLMIYGLPPGPMLFKQHGDFAWTVVASMYIGNVMLLILNLPLVGIWARLCLVPYRILGPVILGVVFIGAYSIRNSMFDVWTAILFGLIGFLMKRRDWPVAPLILGFILGPMLEQHLRASLQGSGGSLRVFIEQPISAGFIVLGVVLVVMSRRLWSAVGKQEAEGER